MTDALVSETEQSPESPSPELLAQDQAPDPDNVEVCEEVIEKTRGISDDSIKQIQYENSSEMGFFEKCLQKMITDKLVPVNVLEITKRSNCYYVSCKPCSKPEKK